MTKTLLSTIIALCMFLSVSIQAQDTILIATFDDSTLDGFKGFSEVGNGEVWTPAEFNDKFFIQMNGFNGGVQENIDWLISPALDMDAYTDETLTFENASNFSGPDLELLLSTDFDGGADPTTATWTAIGAGATWSPGGYEYVESGAIDLSAVEGTAYFAFKYTSSEDLQGKLYQLDNIVVTANTGVNTKSFEEFATISTPLVSNDYLNFSVETTSEVNVSFISINGNEISNLTRNNVSGDVTIPVGDLPAGIYVMIATTEGAVKSFKFSK